MTQAQAAARLSRMFRRHITPRAVEGRASRLRKAASAPSHRPEWDSFDVDLSDLESSSGTPSSAFDEDEPPTNPRYSEQGYIPHPPRGPAESPHYIPAGHELHGVSTLTGPDGEPRGQWSKTRTAGADEPPQPVPESFLLDRASIMQRGDGSTTVQWLSYKRDAVARWEDIKAAVAEHVAAYVRPSPPIEEPGATDTDAPCARIGRSPAVTRGTIFLDIGPVVLSTR